MLCISLIFQWQIRLGETLCYKFSNKGDKGVQGQEAASTIEVTYLVGILYVTCGKSLVESWVTTFLSD